MLLIDARTKLEIVPREECLALLGMGEVGRLGVVDGSHPKIFPVNYAMDGEFIVFRSDDGTKLDAGTRSPVCFEIDGLDPTNRSGWSVVVDGVLEEVTSFCSPELLATVSATGVQPWAGPRKRWLRIIPRRITGRRVGPA